MARLIACLPPLLLVLCFACRPPARPSHGASSPRLRPCGCCSAGCSWARNASLAAPGSLGCSTPSKPPQHCPWRCCSAGGQGAAPPPAASGGSRRASGPSCRATWTAAARRLQHRRLEGRQMEAPLSPLQPPAPSRGQTLPAGLPASWASPSLWRCAAALWPALWALAAAWSLRRCC